MFGKHMVSILNYNISSCVYHNDIVINTNTNTNTNTHTHTNVNTNDNNNNRKHHNNNNILTCLDRGHAPRARLQAEAHGPPAADSKSGIYSFLVREIY